MSGQAEETDDISALLVKYRPPIRVDSSGGLQYLLQCTDIQCLTYDSGEDIL